MARPTKHSKTGIYWFRLTVPADLRAIVGKRELKHSLKTRDRTKAVEGFAPLYENALALFSSLRQGVTTLSRPERHALAGEWYQWFTEKHASDEADGWVWREASGRIREIDEAAWWSEGLTSPPPSDEWERPARVQHEVTVFLERAAELSEFLLSKCMRLSPEAYSAFVAELETEFHAAVNLLARRSDGDFGHDDRPSSFPERKNSNINKAAPGPGQDVLALFEKWKEARKDRAPATLRRYAPSLRSLNAFVNGKAASAITASDIWKWAEYRREADSIAPHVINSNDLVAVRAVLGWATRPNIGLLNSNPAAGITLDVPRVSRGRERSLRAEEAAAILRAARAVQDDPKNPTRAFAERWTPWLAAYSGARIAELTQLRGIDIASEGGVWVMRITPDAGTVKNREPRTIPLHEHLIELGFLTFVQSRGDGPLFYDPQRTKAGYKAATSQAATKAKQMARWVRQNVKLDAALQPNHAWRHTFKTVALGAGIEERVRDGLAGHGPASVGRSYEHPPITMLANAIRRFPRYELS